MRGFGRLLGFARGISPRSFSSLPSVAATSTRVVLPPVASLNPLVSSGSLIWRPSQLGVVRFASTVIPKPLPTPLHDAAKFHPSIPVKVEPREFKFGMKRVGAVGTKIGMTALWDKTGERHPVTVIQLQHTQVIQVRTEETEGVFAMQVGTGRKSSRNLKAKTLNHFAKHGVQPKRYVREFQVSKEGLLPPGCEIRASHFVPGQFIDIQGVSIGKGFQGGMKRWGFAGLGASHGVSVSHRSLGSTGNRQDPGRVWRGKKMPGRMGGDRITVLGLKVVKIDTVLNLLYLRGHVPGHKNGFVRIRDALHKEFPTPPPFPTHIPSPTDPRELVAAEFLPRALTHVKNNWMNEPREKPAPGSTLAPKAKAVSPAPAPAKGKDDKKEEKKDDKKDKDKPKGKK